MYGDRRLRARTSRRGVAKCGDARASCTCRRFASCTCRGSSYATPREAHHGSRRDARRKHVDTHVDIFTHARVRIETRDASIWIYKYHRDVSTLRRMSTFCRSRVVTYKRPPSIAPVRFVRRFSLCAAALTDAGEDDDDDGNDDERKHEEHEDDDAAARTRTRCEDGRATTRANDALRERARWWHRDRRERARAARRARVRRARIRMGWNL